MDQNAVKELIEKRRVATRKLLADAEFQDLEPILLLLKRFRPLDELSAAFLERMAVAPLSEYNALRVLYHRHFVVRVE